MSDAAPSPDLAALGARVDDLEAHAAHQERTIEDLNRMVVEQWRIIEDLTRRVRALGEQLEAFDAGAAAAARPSEPPPPHW